MTDIEQFRELLVANTVKNNINQVQPEKIKQNYDRWTGIVVNNNDTEKLGRVQIKIYGYYDDIDLCNIPWAVPDIKSFTSTKGNFIIPELNSIVRGYFDNGDEMKPIYDSLAFNAAYTSQESNYIEYDIRTKDYPQTMVLFQTDNQDFLVMNKKTGEISFTHHTGTVTKIDSNGNIDISTSIYSGGAANCSLNISGNIQINAFDNISISALGDVEINSTTGLINLGNNIAKQFVCNLPNCLICGSPHQIGNTQVKV